MEVLLLNPTWEVSTPSVFVGGDLASGCVWGVPEVVPFFKKRFYLFIFRERGRKGEREGEKHRCKKHWSVASPKGPDLN